MAAKDRRRGHGEGAIYQTADGRFRAAVDLGWSDGRRQRRYVSGKTRAEAAKKLRQLQQRTDAGLPTENGRPATFETWLNTYLDTIAAPRLRARTLETYKSYASHRIIPALGGHRLTKLTPEHLERFYKDLFTAGLKPSSVLACHRIISRALKIAMQRAYVVRNVATLVDAPSAPRAQIQPPTLDQTKAILKAAKPHRNSARWSVALALGLRQGEALGLRWSDVDFDASTLTVSGALQRHAGKGLVLVEPKSHAGRRIVALPAQLAEMLRAHRTEQVAERLAAGPFWIDNDFVFAQPNGRPTDPSRDYRDWQALLEEAKVPRYRLHDARHFAATLLLSEGVPARVAADILGHSRISMTLDTYSHVSRELGTDAAARVGSALWAEA